MRGLGLGQQEIWRNMVLVAISSIHNAVGQFQSIAIQDAVSEYILSVLFMFVRTFHRDTTMIAWRYTRRQKVTTNMTTLLLERDIHTLRILSNMHT